MNSEGSTQFGTNIYFKVFISTGNITYNRWINEIFSGRSPDSSDQGWDTLQVGSPMILQLTGNLTTSNLATDDSNYEYSTL